MSKPLQTTLSSVFKQANDFRHQNLRSLSFVILCILLSCIAQLSFAQTSKGECELEGAVEDFLSKKPIYDAKVWLLKPDSTVVDTMRTRREYYGTGTMSYEISRYYFTIPIGDYILRVEKEGFEELYFPFSIAKQSRKRFKYTLPAVYLKKEKTVNLDEVTVTATKVKLYHKGDTIVFNADAFQTSEGSTLDALIRQLPGVELKSDGKIYVNGRFVESLLLNGKDFFADNKVMLENLGAYTVKDIQVYEKRGRDSEVMNKDMKDESYVMDVSLKKEYNRGWIANLDAGGTLNGMYLARLFAMRNTDYSSLTMTANLNNLNDFTNVSNGDWNPDKTPYGRLYVKKANINFNLYDKEKWVKLNSFASVTHYDNRQGDNTYKTNFLATGDTYERIIGTQKYDNLYLNTYNTISIDPETRHSRTSVDITANSNYTRNRHKIGSLSALSNEELKEDEQTLRDELQSGVLTSDLKKKLINRIISQNNNDRIKWDTHLETNIRRKMRQNNDMLQLVLNGNLSNNTNERFRHYRIDYPNNSAQSSDFRNEYNKVGGNVNQEYNGILRYYYNPVPELWFYFTYQLKHSYTDTTDDLYRLDRLDGWGIGTENAIGTLPSVAEYAPMIDRANSFRQTFREDLHQPYIYVTWDFKKFEKSSWNAEAFFWTQFYNQKLSYRRGALDTSVSRTESFFLPTLQLRWRRNDKSKEFNLHYSHSNGMQGLNYSLGYTDEADPLNIYKYGVSGLKNSFNQKITASWFSSGKWGTLNAGTGFNRTEDAVAMGYVYDKTTGSRTFTPQNVDGNWTYNANMSLTLQLDKDKKFFFTVNPQWNLINNVDLVSVAESSSSIQSEVLTSNLQNNLSLTYFGNKVTLKAFGELGWIHSESERESFNDVDAFNLKYGLDGNVELPWKFSVSSNLTFYTRRGYEFASMNKTDVLWSGRVSRPICKGRVVLMCDAFDILQQLSYTERTINAQGRMEKFYNPMKRYVLFHAVFKLDTHKKK